MSIRRYVILEHKCVGLTMFERAEGQANWTATALSSGEVLRMPEIGIEIPIFEFYENLELPAANN